MEDYRHLLALSQTYIQVHQKKVAADSDAYYIY